MRGVDDNDNGLIWHWQGSGKTLTMIFAANKLFQMRDTANPSIFFIVDRDELETQLIDNFAELDLFGAIEKITSIEKLKEILEHDNYKGKRGIFITLIHKFRQEQLAEFNIEMERIKKESEKQGTGELTITGRKNVICFIDEAHRSQYGLLAAQMEEVFKSGSKFAFTGTPIAYKDRNTYKKYSPGNEQYLDKYFMVDSIKDRFTLKIAYEPRLADDVHIDNELLEVFYDQDDVDEIGEEMKETVDKKVREKLNAINVVLEHPDSIKLVAKDLSAHFKENLDGKFKAVVIAASRRACAMYKEELDKYFPESWTEVIMTMGQKESDPKIAAQYERITRKYNEKDISVIKKKVTDEFKKSADTLPKILIVTEMLIAGFDAPVLQTIYLHKALKNHRLLQAIARTNRPYREKEAGLVIDYAGVLDNIKSAFKAYDESDREDVLYDFDKLAEQYTQAVKDCAALLGNKPDYNDYTPGYIIEKIKFLSAEDRRSADFEEKYRGIRRLYEMLGSSDVKLKLIKEYKWLSAIYGYFKKSFGEDEDERYVRKYFKRTLENIYNAVEIKKLTELPGVMYDEKHMAELLKAGNESEIKAASIIFALRKYVLVEKAKNPIYEALAERVRRLIQEWQDNALKYEGIITEGIKIFGEKKAIEDKQKELKMDNIEYAIFMNLAEKWKLEENEAVDTIKEIKEAINKEGGFILDYISNPEIKKIIAQTVRRIFRRKYKFPPDKLDGVTESIVNDIIGVKDYGSDDKDKK
jgi:type I restriction enzyme R subunit